tara:strand:- start:7810 stop:8832 length:1023 start_codon:yes stop_codon:yes gene_type:complete
MPSGQNTMMKARIGNGLLSTLSIAYSHHVPVRIRPDDIWHSIVSSFGYYVSTHAEEMRAYFVRHEGKIELIASSVNVEGLIHQFGALIEKNTHSVLQKWIVPEFSTTRPIDQAVAKVQMMSAMQEYFEFRGYLCCGLSEVILEGTLEDWNDLRARAQRLSEFGEVFKQWQEVLVPVLDQFIDAYQGRVDEDFWQRMVTSERLGSGSNRFLKGWFLVFSPFNAKGEYHLNSLREINKTHIYGRVDDRDIIDSTLSVPVKLETLDRESFSTVFSAGLMGPAYSADTNELRPQVGWYVTEVKEEVKPAPSLEVNEPRSEKPKKDRIENIGAALAKAVKWISGR